MRALLKITEWFGTYGEGMYATGTRSGGEGEAAWYGTVLVADRWVRDWRSLANNWSSRERGEKDVFDNSAFPTGIYLLHVGNVTNTH